ncbi:MAG: hypothetical protein HXS46_01810 [Theionarchaea archaeon]|nr:MAG: hypothetical protein AYK18_03835 [Theionarchaea archaeon DG-70]MBU7009397.1 hypothetical protein [Theionarchaea archaeon]
MAEKGETLTSQLMPVLLGLITDSILDSIGDLELNERVLIIIGMGIIYGLLYTKRKSSKKSKYEQKKLEVPANPGKLEKDTTSRRVTVVLLIGFIIAIVLVGAASLILGLTRRMILQLMGWLVLMIVFVLSGNFLSSARMAFYLRAVAAVSLGGALSIGGVPTYEFITAGPVELTIENYCSDPIVYDVYGLAHIEVPGNAVRTVELKPVTVTFTRDENFVFVYAFCRTVPYAVPEDALVSFDGQEIKPGESLTVHLSGPEPHKLVVECKS